MFINELYITLFKGLIYCIPPIYFLLLLISYMTGDVWVKSKIPVSIRLSFLNLFQ